MSPGAIQSQLICKAVGFDKEALAAELATLSDELWTAHVNQADYEGGWSVVALRTLKIHADSHPILQSFQIEAGDDWIDLPILESLKTVKKLLGQIPFRKKSVRLMKLNPGAHIKEHRDKGLSLERGEARLHIPLQSDDGVEFISNGKRLDMSDGELWYINADAPHSVRNTGNIPRTNLVVDCAVSNAEFNAYIRSDVCHA